MTSKNKYIQSLKVQNKLSPEEIITLVDEAEDLLSKCINPITTNSNRTTGIAIGKIQSGKTSSMEMLSHIAKDNGFKIIVVLSGTNEVLTKQTQSRFYESIKGFGWHRIYIPGNSKNMNINTEITKAVRSLETWDKSDYDANEKRTVFIITMKHHGRIRRMTDFLERVMKEKGLDNIPALIIDDECDHYSLNTEINNEANETNDEEYEANESENYRKEKFITLDQDMNLDEISNEYGVLPNEVFNLNKNNEKLHGLQFKDVIPKGSEIQIAPRESTTHRRIKDLREKFNLHTYIGYTATPWPSFLIPTINNLSPDFHQLITPGINYKGAQYFFSEDNQPHIQQIPYGQIDSLFIDGQMPASLDFAIKSFLLGVAKFIHEKKHLKESGSSISMMISPGEETGASAERDEFTNHEYITQLVSRYLIKLREILSDEGSVKCEEELKSLREVYENLELTQKQDESSLPKFNSELIRNFKKAISFTEVVEFNARSTSTIPVMHWNVEGFSRILIGGVGLSRGYTVEGITTSYMPRNMSEQESTTFQRARFFGYHKDYLSLVRIWIPQETINGFSFLRRREQDTWNLLQQTEKQGIPLKEMPRMILRDNEDRFRPARRAVMGFQRLQLQSPLQSLHDANSWRLDDHQIDQRYRLYSSLRERDSKSIEDISVRENFNHLKHRVIDDLNLSAVLDILETLEFDRSQILSWDTIFFSMRRFIEQNNDCLCPIILMNNRDKNGDKLQRGISETTNTIVIQSNRSGNKPEDFDRLIQYEYLRGNNSELPDLVPTLQIYNFDIRENTDPKADIYKRNVTFFYLYTPQNFMRDYDRDIYIEN